MLSNQFDHKALFALTEQSMIEQMREAAGQQPAFDLLDGLFGSVRRLYKRVTQFSLFQEPQLYGLLARRPYPWLVQCAENFAELASEALGLTIAPHEILFDAPPIKLEVQFQIDVQFAKEDCYRSLGEISPVVKTLAKQQFDEYVKRVRILAHPRVASELSALNNLSALINSAIDRTNDEVAG